MVYSQRGFEAGQEFEMIVRTSLLLTIEFITILKRYILQSNLSMWATYSFNQKFGSIGIPVFRDVTKIGKNSSIIKMSRTFILHNNNSERLLIKSLIKIIVLYCSLSFFRTNSLIFYNHVNLVNFFVYEFIFDNLKNLR